MAQHCIKGKRIRRVCIPKEYDIDKIQIGIPVICDEAKTVGLNKNGDVVLPSGIFGAQCRRNAYGYSYADKSKPKERRYVSTNWVHPFGNTNASEVAVDIYRPCWPQVEVPPYGIELQLFKSKDGQLYVIVVLNGLFIFLHLPVCILWFFLLFGIFLALCHFRLLGCQTLL